MIIYLRFQTFFFFFWILIDCSCLFIGLGYTLKGFILFWLLFWTNLLLDLFELGVIFLFTDFILCLLLLLTFICTLILAFDFESILLANLSGFPFYSYLLIIFIVFFYSWYFFSNPEWLYRVDFYCIPC